MNFITCKSYKALPPDSSRITLDVRRQDEWDAGHIEDALHIPLDILPVVAQERLVNKDAHIVMCCQSGGRAIAAADILQKMGYTRVDVLDGGYSEYCASIGRK